MSELVVARLSPYGPKKWTGSYGPMETYTVKFEGDERKVEVNRKPGNTPAVGDVLYGTIEAIDLGGSTVFKFKKDAGAFPARKPGTSFSSPKDTTEIKAEWAIGQAIAWLSRESNEAMLTDVEPLAKDFFRMVSRVKEADSTAGYDKAKAVAEQIKSGGAVAQTFADGTPLPSDETISLDDIPF